MKKGQDRTVLPLIYCMLRITSETRRFCASLKMGAWNDQIMYSTVASGVSTVRSLNSSTASRVSIGPKA